MEDGGSMPWSLLVLLAGCLERSPYPWDGIGHGAAPEGCSASVAFRPDAAVSALEVQCVDQTCRCRVGGVAGRQFEDPTFCDRWARAYHGSVRRQDRMVGAAVVACGAVRITE
jgi:hypothetical protein